MNNIVQKSFMIANEMLSGGAVDRIKRAVMSHDPLIKFSGVQENVRKSYETIIRFIYKLKDTRPLEDRALLVAAALRSIGAVETLSQKEASAIYFEMFGDSKTYKVSVTKSQVTIKIVE